MNVSIVKKMIKHQNVVYSYYETSGMNEWLHPELACFGLTEIEARKLLKHFAESVTQEGKVLSKRGIISWQGMEVYCAWMPVTYKYYFFPLSMARALQDCLKEKYDYNLRLTIN